MTVRKRTLRGLRLFGFFLMVSLSCFFLIRWFEYSFSEDLPLSDKSIALEPASSTSSSSLSNAKLIVQWTNVFGKRMAEANMEDCSLSPEVSLILHEPFEASSDSLLFLHTYVHRPDRFTTRQIHHSII